MSSTVITDSLILSAIASLPNKDVCLNEANYGLKYIHNYVDALKPNASVLEVGSGPCVLLSHLCSSFKSQSFTGIEPIGPGFENFRESLNKLKANFKFKLFEGIYEDFQANSSEKFDLIFLINVFEHLPDWRDFLKFVRAHLKDDGKCVILCPNYSFPYESHFGIPIVFNKSLTHKIFRKYIEDFEVKGSSFGLWSSLNFVKLRQVRRAAVSLNLKLNTNNQIVSDLIKRLSYDEEFAKRQRTVGKIAKVLDLLGVIKLLKLYPLNLIQPYMYLEIQLKPTPPQP